MVRARLLWNNGNLRTTSELEDDMSAADMELIMLAYEPLTKQDSDRLANAVNRGFCGDKK